MELLKTERLILREWEESDEEALIEIAVQDHIRYWLPDWDDCASWALLWIKGTVQLGYKINNPFEHFMTWAITLKDTGTLIGMINIGGDEFENKEVGIGYFIDKRYSNNGYITEAVKNFIKYIFRTYKYDYIVATVQPENFASIAVVKKAGFELIKTIMSFGGGRTVAVPKNYYKLYYQYV